jgi:hypothetical protein
MLQIQCPKCGYIRSDKEMAPDYECPKCGVIYAKVKSKNESLELPETACESNVNVQNVRATNTLTSDPRINAQLQKIGQVDMWLTKREIQYLPSLIRNDEIIQGLASGFHDRKTWLIVVTNQRILFLDKGLIYGLKQLEMHYDQISAVAHSMGLLLAKITISTSAGSKTIEQIKKKDAPKITKLISNLIRKSKEPQTRQGQEQNDIVSQLERLSVLLQKGILTNEEFTNQKMKLLNS